MQHAIAPQVWFGVEDLGGFRCNVTFRLRVFLDTGALLLYFLVVCLFYSSLRIACGDRVPCVSKIVLTVVPEGVVPTLLLSLYY